MQVEAVKNGLEDKEVYIKVAEQRKYKVIIKDKESGKIIKRTTVVPSEKVVKRGGKTYKYYYIRLTLPWASTISRVLKKRRDVYNLVIEVV